MSPLSYKNHYGNQCHDSSVRFVLGKDRQVFLLEYWDYTAEGKEVFFNDIKSQDAVLRNIQVMCESIQKLPIDWKNAFPETK